MEEPEASWMQRHPRVVDAAVVFFAALPSFIGAPAQSTGGGFPSTASPVAYLILSIAAAGLWWRRSNPHVSMSLALAAAPALALVHASPVRGVPMVLVALFSVALYRGRKAAIAWTFAAMLILLAGTLPMDFRDPLAFAVVAWCGLAAALGDAVRSNRTVLAAAQERARRAEATREEEAARRVAEERLRISRELHDVVAHHIAVINVQAGVAEHLVRSDPETSAQALSVVRQASRDVLAETRAMVGLLREKEADLEPAPTLARLPDLISGVRAGGASVSFTSTGNLGDVPAGIDLQAFRILQEALTNAGKHGSGAIHAELSVRDSSVDIHVRNPVPVGATRGSGHGLIGMRERAALCDGTFEAELHGGDFVVDVRLPIPPQQERP